jgi:hypothetical protein
MRRNRLMQNNNHTAQEHNDRRSYEAVRWPIRAIYSAHVPHRVCGLELDAFNEPPITVTLCVG